MGCIKHPLTPFTSQFLGLTISLTMVDKEKQDQFLGLTISSTMVDKE